MKKILIRYYLGTILVLFSYFNYNPQVKGSPHTYYIDIIGYGTPFIFPNVVNGRFFAVNGKKQKARRYQFFTDTRGHTYS